jgi:hypothetical protein
MGDVTEDDIGKSIFTTGGNEIGTLRGIDGPTLYIAIAEDIDSSLRSDMKISETTGHTDDDGTVLAGATRASVSDVIDDEIHFWPSYAAEADHESVEYDEIPGQDSNIEPEDS